jgi:S1-C subfamily serine protease
MRFNIIDLVIVVAILVAIGNGYRRGFWLSLFQYLGLLAGVLVGAALAPAVVDIFHISRGAPGAVAAFIVLVVAGSLGSTIGFRLGSPIRVRLLYAPDRGRVDSVAGAIFSLMAVLIVSWFLGLSFARGPTPQVAGLIQRSAILRALDGIAPRPPAFLARVQQILAGVPFPSAFSGFEPLISQPLQIPSSADTPGIRAAAAETLKVVGRGCGGLVFGSGFPIGGNQVLTNAHVVAGTAGTHVDTPTGGAFAAVVVLFDPERDVAVLNVPGLGEPALLSATAERGTQGAAIGYPGGRGETVSPAVVDGQVQAEGRDIYGQNLVVRQIWIIQARVQPGNSGGPLVDRDGSVVGVVFATSTNQPNQAYALTNDEVSPDIQKAVGKTQPVPVGNCAE